MPVTELSPTMKEAIAYAVANGGKLTRFPGGYWRRADGSGIHFDTTTVQALVRRGRASYTKMQSRGPGLSEFPIEMTVSG